VAFLGAGVRGRAMTGKERDHKTVPYTLGVQRAHKVGEQRSLEEDDRARLHLDLDVERREYKPPLALVAPPSLGREERNDRAGCVVAPVEMQWLALSEPERGHRSDERKPEGLPIHSLQRLVAAEARGCAPENRSDRQSLAAVGCAIGSVDSRCVRHSRPAAPRSAALVLRLRSRNGGDGLV